MARNYKKLIRVFEDRPSYALGVRVYVADSAFVHEWVDYAEEVAHHDPHAGYRLAITAVRLALRNGDRCLRVRAIALCSSTLRALGRHCASERYFPYAFQLAEGCPECLSLLKRQLARLRSAQRRFSEAFDLAESAIAYASKPLGRGRSLACRAMVLFYSEQYTAAAEDFQAALDLLPKDKKPPILHGYTAALAMSKEPRLVQKAASLVPEVEDAFRDVRGQSIFRAKLHWLKGGVAARIAEDEKESLSPWQRYRHEREAAHHLGKALRKLVKHRHKAGKRAGMPALPLEIAACAADLAAVEARVNRYKVAEIFAVALEAWPEELEKLRRAVCCWAEARKPGAAGQMWAALRRLRDLTVEAGCAPPLVPYLDPAEAL